MRASECESVEEDRAAGAAVVGDRVRYGNRVWRVVGMYLVYDPASGRTEEYYVLDSLNNGRTGPTENG